MVLNDHPALRGRHARGLPSKPLCAYDRPVKCSTQENPSDPRPYFLLLDQSFGVANTLDVVTQSKEPEKQADELDSMPKSPIRGDLNDCSGFMYAPRAACLVKSAGGAEYIGIFEPVLTRLRTHVRTELSDQSFAKCGEPALAEHLPYLGIRKALKCSDLQLQKMVLIWVEIDCMYAPRTCLIKVVKNVITGRRHTENDIFAVDIEEAMIDTRIFPSECVDILVVELGVLLESVIVIDAPLVILVEH